MAEFVAGNLRLSAYLLGEGAPLAGRRQSHGVGGYVLGVLCAVEICGGAWGRVVWSTEVACQRLSKVQL